MSMKRWSYLIYGAVCHLLFLATFAYMAGFVGDFVVSKSIDSPASNDVWAVAIDILLMMVFALQHSIMARPWFKRFWTRLVPEPIERSTYVLLSSAVVILLMWQWRSLDFVIWDVKHPLGRGLLWFLFAAGWVLVPGVTFMINHFDLFGTRQVWLHLRGRQYSVIPFRTPLLYRVVRHPLYIGWTLAFWATPTMTTGHLLFAAAMTFYMAVAALFEERDLVTVFGAKYVDYQRRVPMFIPGLTRKRRSPNPAVTAPATTIAADPSGSYF
jgi:methanethiol S-methyltransferase